MIAGNVDLTKSKNYPINSDNRHQFQFIKLGAAVSKGLGEWTKKQHHWS